MIPPRFTEAEFDHAHDAWGANCGPGTLAAMLGMTLEDLRPHMGDFETKRYTNPLLMWDILHRLKVNWRLVKPARTWPDYGLARVQWEGPWTAPGVPARAAYRHTHWVGAIARNPENIGIFDINALANGTGWCGLTDWAGGIVPEVLKACVPRASGRWHLTHVVEIELQ